jgi:sulfur-oxidizing protein SoxY
MNSCILTRRKVLEGALALAGGLVLVRTAKAGAPQLSSVIADFAKGAEVKAGRVRFEIAPLVENGNTVPVSVRVESPMTPQDYVAHIAIFNEKNPEREVIRLHLTPRAGRAEVSTRIRLATSQKLVALARMSDGSVWSHTVDVLVTLAGCIEGGT